MKPSIKGAMGNSQLLLLVFFARLLKECACHEDSFRDSRVLSSTESSCPEYAVRLPHQCSDSKRGCDYEVKWEDSGKHAINLTLRARTGSKDGWSAVGFTNKGVAQQFILCLYNGNSSSVQLTHSVNHSLVSVQNPVSLQLIEGFYTNEVFTCSFSLSKDYFGEPVSNRRWHLVLTSGTYANNSTFASRVNYSDCACDLTSCRDCCSSDNGLRRLLMKLHGVVMMVVFMVFIPVAALVARYYKPILPDSWFKVHMTMMVLSVAATLCGLGLILWHTGGKLTEGVHQYIGLVCIGLAVLQPAYGFLRPPLGNTTRRKVFNVVHRLGAISIISLGMFNLFSGGLKLHSMIVSPLMGTLALHVGVSLVTAMILEFLSRPVSSGGHVGYRKIKKAADNSSSEEEEEVFVKEDSLKRPHIIVPYKNETARTYAVELIILVTYVFLSFSLSGLASGMVYYN